MNTQAPESTESKPSSWWDRATDTEASVARGKKILTVIIVLAVGVAAATGIRGFMASQDAEARAAVSDLILEGELLLPPTRGAQGFAGQVNEAAGFYNGETRDLLAAGFRWGALGDTMYGTSPEKAAEYKAQIESLLAAFSDKENAASDGPQAWAFANVRQQLMWFAAINSAKPSDRIELLNQQLSLLSHMESKWGEHPVLSAIVDPVGHPGVTLMGIWKERAEKEVSFWTKNPTIAPLTTDEGLTATITLDNDKAVKMEFYSRVAPRTVANFLRLAKSGFYNGTAFHAITETSVEGGDPLSRLCPDRPRVWHKGSVGYRLPQESSARLSGEAGSVSMGRDVGGLHGSRFMIHTKEDPGKNFGAYTVFARVVEGIEALVEYTETDTIDDEQAENPNLPVAPMRIKSIQIEGEQVHTSEDSWVPVLVTPKAPEQTPEEKRLEDEAKKEAEDKANDKANATDPKESKEETSEKPGDDNPKK